MLELKLYILKNSDVKSRCQPEKLKNNKDDMQQNKILGKKTIYQLLCQKAEGSGILEELKGHLVCPVRILQEFYMNSVQILEELLGQTA